jgi:hypothetical protein
MMRYLLEGWQDELDLRLHSEWNALVGTAYRRRDTMRKLHYEMVTFVQAQVQRAEYLPSFQPFAIAYADQQAGRMCDAFESKHVGNYYDLAID